MFGICSYRYHTHGMVFHGMAMIMAGIAFSSVRGAQPAPCPSDTMAINVTSHGGIQALTDALNCTGAGMFDVTLHGHLQLKKIIDVSDQKNVTITGFVDNARDGTSDACLYADIDDGNGTGLISVSNGSTLSIHNLLLKGGFSTDGGAVSVTAASHLYVFDCQFINNTASSAGGGIFANRSSVNIGVGNYFFGNSANVGGAMYIASPNNTSAIVSHSTFRSNRADIGAAIYVDAEEAILALKHCRLFHNHAITAGGAIYHSGGITLTKSQLWGNAAGQDGMAIASAICGSSWVVLEDVEFSNNLRFCPIGLSQGRTYGVGSAVFDTVCHRCSPVPNTVPDGVSSDSVWLIPLCEEPPKGTLALSIGSKTTSLTLEKGYYRDSTHSLQITKCFRPESCIGGRGEVDYCAVGYRGTYCASCSRGYSLRRGYVCSKCSGVEKHVAVGVAAAVGLVALLAAFAFLRHLARVVDSESTARLAAPQCFVHRKFISVQVMVAKALSLQAVKITVVVWQIMIQFSAVAKDVFPEEYEKFLSYIITLVNFDIGVIVSYSCLLSPSFHGRLLFATITPMLVLTILAMAYHVVKRRGKSEQLNIAVRHRHQSAAVYAAFFVYSSVSSVIFQTFPCEDRFNGDRSLKADHSILCGTDLHQRFVIYAGVMTVVYPIGIPAFFSWWLRQNRQYLKTSDRDTAVHLQPCSGIWSAYTPSRYYYELVEYGRRLTFSMSSAFLVPDSVDHIAIVFSLAMVFLFVSESLSPFKSSVDMGLYRWGNGVVLSSMYVALLMKAKESDGELRAHSVFGWLLITANIVMIIVIVVETILSGGVMTPSMPRVKIEVSPVRSQTLVTSKNIPPIHHSLTFYNGNGETKLCNMSERDDMVLPDPKSKGL